jgi:hypothetical protein
MQSDCRQSLLACSAIKQYDAKARFELFYQSTDRILCQMHLITGTSKTAIISDTDKSGELANANIHK